MRRNFYYILKSLLENIVRAYVGIIINSNYSRGYGLISFNTKNPYKKSLTHYL